MNKKIVLLLVVLCCAFSGQAQKKNKRKSAPAPLKEVYYQNPVLGVGMADPTVLRTADGYYYVYATERKKEVPIYRSRNLVDWEFVAPAFTPEGRPSFVPKAGIWAPDINYIDGRYVLYYAMSVWGGQWTCGIGVATSPTPEGPFTDRGELLQSERIGVQNSIDACIFEENGHKYMFWGSFHGIHYVELTDDGLAVKPGAKPVRITGDAYEATYVHKRGKYYYLFASIGSCCAGDKSTYTTVVGRSENLFGPYLNRAGENMLDNKHEIVIKGTEKFVGPGHNARIVTDDAGDDWMLYHAFLRGESDRGRLLLLDRVDWINDWPEVNNGIPSETSMRGPAVR